ncbi:MAG: protein CapI [Candidatus Marinimicrobia bacterium]|nr:protein CapI [Candidatus Neomarinimicrobiota bacterium]|tara:strand:+ start:189 stop:1145 length:957 start_codon:yes stop_codon:yes gene_type:complete
MRIIVTGAAGFIGYHLSKSLALDGFEVLGIDNISEYYDTNLKYDRLSLLKKYDNFRFKKLDISNRESLAKVFRAFKPKKVVNLAAQPGVRYSLTNPYEYMRSNLDGFINIIELCKNSYVEGLIYASSSSVYGLNNKMPFSINDRVDSPISLYGVTKRSNELIAHSYSHLFNINTTGLRFFTVYGPWYRPDMAMYIFINKIIHNKPISVFNNGQMKRDFTYIDDIIDGTRAAIDNNFKFEIFNLGNNKSEKLMDMITIIENELGLKAVIDFKPLQPGDAVETYADIKYTQKKIDFHPKTTIKIGIPKLIDWYKKYHKTN